MVESNSTKDFIKAKLIDLKHNKLALTLLIIIIILGIFIRLNDYSNVGYWNDDIATIPASLLWFYPHTFYPSLAADAEPPIGIYLIGKGCMMSGVDFSPVSKVLPNFYVGRDLLLGKQMLEARGYCHFPIYLFGILFFISIIILSFLLLNKKATLYSVSFFAFLPYVLKYSRWIKPDIISWFFITLGLIFLWLAYRLEKGQKNEILFFIIASSFFGLSQGVKEPSIMFMVLLGIIIIVKYWKEITLNIKTLLNHKPELKIPFLSVIYSAIAYLFFVLLPYGFNLKQVYENIKFKATVSPGITEISLNKQFLTSIKTFLVETNTLDILVILLAVYVIYKLIKIPKQKHQKFILTFFIFSLLCLIPFTALNVFYAYVPFAISFVLLMSLAFDKRSNPLIEKIKPSRIIIYIFLIIYIIFSFAHALNLSPYFTPNDSISCLILKDECDLQRQALGNMATEEVADKLTEIMNANETFYGPGGIIYTYIRQDEGVVQYYTMQAIEKEFGRPPKIEDMLKYFQMPDGRTIRYLLIMPHSGKNERFEYEGFYEIEDKFKPNYRVPIQNITEAKIYDIYNLQPI
ncbi:MAG: phospholipid carrier-dependent glycosyltransferase [Candidatus Nanoarchaeia archaeon]|nr:phospholipid carrier-dependent glycosyltransferase [Candidatus Nanoarchaeia archaeon]